MTKLLEVLKFKATMVVGLLLATSAVGGPRVVATTADAGSIVGAVGGDRIELIVLAKGYMDPHYLEAKPSYMSSLRRADLLVYNGLQLEVGWLPLIIRGARNRKIVFGEPGHLDLSRGISVLEIPETPVSRAQGDIHPEGNPHYTMDPRNWIIMSAQVEEALSRIDPPGAAIYRSRARAFRERLQAAIGRWRQRLAGLEGHRVISFHKHWEYLADWLNLEIVDYVERKPGIPASPQHLRDLERRIRQENLQLLLSTTFASRDPLKHLRQHTEIEPLPLPGSVGAIDEITDPFELFEHIVSALEAKLHEAQAKTKDDP